MIGIAAAIAAAVAFGLSTAMMHHSAFRAPAHVKDTWALLRHLVVQRTWLLGMAASLAGFVFHAVALRFGSLALVQPLVVTGLVFSFVFRAVLERRLPQRGLVVWVIVSAVGMALFVIGAGSIRGSNHLDGPAAVAIFGIGAFVAIAAIFAARQAGPRNAGVLLGIAAGVVFGLIAATIKAATNAAAHGTLLTSWPLYVLGPMGAVAFLLNQRAYHRAPLSASLPALNMANPLVAVAFGIAAFHERPSGDPVAIVAETLGLAGVFLGIFFLARHEDDASVEHLLA